MGRLRSLKSIRKKTRKVKRNSKRIGEDKLNPKFYSKKHSKKQSVEKIRNEILESSDISQSDSATDADVPDVKQRDMLEQIMFKLPYVINPLVGTPKDVQKELDALAKRMQRKPKDNSIFNRIHLYMHAYLVNVVLRKFPFIKGIQNVDIYQETLIALRFKAIPNFKNNKGMSFLNFAKMCIRRHLITLLNASKNRKKDQSMNRAISIDSSPIKDDEEGKNTFANIIPDGSAPVDKTIAINEAYEITKKNLMDALSEFERVVLREYLASSSYREISRNISQQFKKRYNTKSIDNALLRIRKKAYHLMEFGKFEDVPLFMENIQLMQK